MQRKQVQRCLKNRYIFLSLFYHYRPFDDVVLPKDSTKSDWEVELAVVIGKKVSYVEEAQAMDHVAGYCLHNDLSERAFQLERGGQWVKGKSCNTFAPLGPFLATKDEITDVNNLRL